MATSYHSQYWACALTLRAASGSIQSLSRSIANARVDLNPHQVDAAMFALRSPVGPVPDLDPIRQGAVRARLRQVEQRNSQFFDEEVIKLDRWSDDLKTGLEREIKELDKQIREARKLSVLAGSLAEKLAAQKGVKGLETARNKKRRELFDAQDAIDQQRDGLIAKIENQMRQRHNVQPVFLLQWNPI